MRKYISENFMFDDEYNVHDSLGDDDFMEVRMPISKWRSKDGMRLEDKMREMGYKLYDVGQLDRVSVVTTFKKDNRNRSLDEAITRAIRKLLR